MSKLNENISVGPLMNRVELFYKNEDAASFNELVMSLIDQDADYKSIVGGPAPALKDKNKIGYIYHLFYIESRFVNQIIDWSNKINDKESNER